MPNVSAIVSTVFLGLLVWKTSFWGVMPPAEKLWTGLTCFYGILLAITGWCYAFLKFRPSGWIHALLMLGVAATSGYLGFRCLSDQSIAGGSGPDANPVGGILYLIGFAYCVRPLSQLFAAAVSLHIYRRKMAHLNQWPSLKKAAPASIHFQ